MNRSQQLQAKAKEILANCKENENGCLVWQGRTDDNGYGYIQLGGQTHRIQRIVAVYSPARETKQTENLKKFRVSWDCGNRICMKLAKGHMKFTTGSEPQEYETLVKWWENF